MTKVKIRASSNSSELKGRLLNLCVKHSIRVTKLLQISDGYLSFCASAGDADKLFSNKVYPDLMKIDCEPIMPQQLKSMRSVMLRRVDDIILNHTPKEIQSEIVNCNDWSEVKEVIKIPNSKLLKIVFHSAEMSHRCIKDGVFIFRLFVPPANIAREEYHQIKTCYRCYKIEDHNTIHCPEPSSFKLCSLCSSKEHSWKQCTSKTKKCSNCDGEHTCLSMSCPVRKNAVNRGRSKTSTPLLSSYASAAARSSYSAAPLLPPSLLTDTVKSYSCIMLAILKNEELPGSFETSLNTLFAANKLPRISLGDFQPPNMRGLLHSGAPHIVDNDVTVSADVGEGDSTGFGELESDTSGRRTEISYVDKCALKPWLRKCTRIMIRHLVVQAIPLIRT